LTGPRSSRVSLLRDGRHRLKIAGVRRSDRCRLAEAAGADQSREAPTERREGLSCANASAKMKFGASGLSTASGVFDCVPLRTPRDRPSKRTLDCPSPRGRRPIAERSVR
jgi:hypothetical protein